MKKRTLAHENDWYYNNYIMRLLIVEDENDLRNIVKKRLVKEHYSVDACWDGLEAMDYIDMTSYDGIILDIMLPGKDGYEILRELRQREENLYLLIWLFLELTWRTEELRLSSSRWLRVNLQFIVIVRYV